MTQLRSARFVSYVVVPALLVLVSGCHKWTRIELGPQMPDRVRVTYSDVSCVDNPKRVTLEETEVLANQLQGTKRQGTVRGDRVSAVSIPRADICKVEGSAIEPVGTAMLSILGLALVGIIAFAAFYDPAWN